jgi:F-type H+-transporting ATPase subunit b
MPQLTQLSDVVLSQLFWLAITLGFIYFVIARGMLPKIQSTVDLRDQKIAQDLASAESARAETDKMEEAYRERMDASRADAMKLTAAAKSDVAKAIEKKVAKADAVNQAKLDKANERIRAARESARAEIVTAAAEMTQAVADKVAGLKVSKDEALKAVETAHG